MRSRFSLNVPSLRLGEMLAQYLNGYIRRMAEWFTIVFIRPKIHHIHTQNLHTKGFVRRSLPVD